VSRTVLLPGSEAKLASRDWRVLEAMGMRRLTADSRQVRRGDTFVAYPGESRDGRDYIQQAITQGAGSVLWEQRGYTWRDTWPVHNVGVKDLRRHAGEIASRVYGRPSSRLWMVGVTGTNGKTSCSQWVAQGLARGGRRCAVIGTLGSGWPGRPKSGVNTTPDAILLQDLLRKFERAGAAAVSMEVSSHGLAQHRVQAVEFDVALLTNLTRDHLDFHGTMRAYKAAKAGLFHLPSLRHAVLNLDDPFGVELASTRRRGLSVLGYGFDKPAIGRIPHLAARNLRLMRAGIRFDVSTPWGAGSVHSRVIGRFNAANLLGTLAVLLVSGMAFDESMAALQRVRPVPGRTECIGGGRRPLVVVDYAHTPDALDKVLRSLREISSVAAGPHAKPRQARLICVFGCGGERDRGKRPLMARAATRLADYTVITSDNPRGERPGAILADIMAGVQGECTVVPERAQAIREAIIAARRGDTVLIAGKGHERYQEIRGVRHPFSDLDVARRLLRELWA